MPRRGLLRPRLPLPPPVKLLLARPRRSLRRGAPRRGLSDGDAVGVLDDQGLAATHLAPVERRDGLCVRVLQILGILEPATRWTLITWMAWVSEGMQPVSGIQKTSSCRIAHHQALQPASSIQMDLGDACCTCE